MREKYGKLFSKASELASMHDERFFPGLVDNTGKMNVCIKSPVFEYEDFVGGREVFLEMLELCDKLEITADDNGMLTMVATVNEIK